LVPRRVAPVCALCVRGCAMLRLSFELAIWLLLCQLVCSLCA
jgi:hypothetical protein